MQIHLKMFLKVGRGKSIHVKYQSKIPRTAQLPHNPRFTIYYDKSKWMGHIYTSISANTCRAQISCLYCIELTKKYLLL